MSKINIECRKSHFHEFVAICTIFFTIGFLFSTWASRIPAIRDSALLLPATLGYALLARGMGSLVMMPITGWLINNYGAKKIAYFFGFIATLSLIPTAYSPNWVLLGISLIILGGACGGFNLAINAIAAHHENRVGKSRMSTIHSWFGVGNLFGSIVGVGASAALISARLHFVLASVLMVVILATALHYIQQTQSRTVAKKLTWPTPPIIWLGFIIFLAVCTEASIMNWINLFYSDFLGAGERKAAIGYTIYATAALCMRFLGDRFRPMIGAQQLIILGTISAALGILIAIQVQHLLFSSIGIFLMGAGIALTFPFVFSVAGRISANALATVMIFGGIGELVSQPIMGFVVQHFGLDGGFYTIAGIILLTTFFAVKAKLLRDNTNTV